MGGSWWSFLSHGSGCLILVRLIYEAANFFWTCFLRPARDLKDFGEWAVVTGATDGIGKAISLELASKGLKVLLISRNPERLADTKKEVEAAFSDKSAKNTCDVLALDCNLLGKGDPAALNQVRGALKNKNIAVLVNNVGISYEHAEYFHDISEERISQIIDLNVGATTWMSRLVLKEMLNKDEKSVKDFKKGKGTIVSIASSSCVTSCPLLSQYSAAKAYICRFSQSMDAEYSPQGVSFQVQPAHFVTTKLAKLRNPSLMIASPAQYARASVRVMGAPDINEISPFWSHYLIVAAARWLPSEIVNAYNLSIHKSIRNRALKKKAEKAA